MSKIHKKNSAAEKKLIRKATTEFHVARSTAINTYALLEQNMALMFAKLSGAKHREAYIAFEAVIDSRSRWVMLEKLLTLAHGNNYKTFFAGLKRDVGGINSTRNNIVHWMISTQSRGAKPFDPEQDIFLAEHPNLFGQEKISLNELNEFSHKTEFYALLIFYFGALLEEINLQNDTNKTPWHEIFRSKPVYPPPSGHPLDHLHKKP